MVDMAIFIGNMNELEDKLWDVIGFQIFRHTHVDYQHFS